MKRPHRFPSLHLSLQNQKIQQRFFNVCKKINSPIRDLRLGRMTTNETVSDPDWHSLEDITEVLIKECQFRFRLSLG